MWKFARSGGRKGVVGVELRDDAIAFAYVTHRAGKPGASVFEYHPIDATPAPSVLCDLVQRHGLRGTDCVGVLPQGTYQLLQVDPPDVPDEEKRQAVKWRLRERIDFPVANAVVDVFDPPQRAKRRANNLNAVVCPIDVVAQCVDVIGASGLHLRALDIAELVQRNVLAALIDDGEAVALLTFQEHDGLIILVKDTELYLARDLDSGLQLIREASAAGQPSAPVYDSIVLELQRSLDYFESSFGMAAITRVLVHPSTGVEQLIAHIQNTLPALQTEILTPASVFDTAAEVPQGCLNAFGAALRNLEVAA